MREKIAYSVHSATRKVHKYIPSPPSTLLKSRCNLAWDLRRSLRFDVGDRTRCFNIPSGGATAPDTARPIIGNTVGILSSIQQRGGVRVEGPVIGENGCPAPDGN